MARFRRHFEVYSLIFVVAALASVVDSPLVMAETMSWPWVPTTNCAGYIGNKLEFRSVTVEPNTQVCVLPPSYQYSSSLRWYVGVYIGAQYFPETTSETELPRCATVTDSNTPLIISSTNCTTTLLTYPGSITYTPGTAPPEPVVVVGNPRISERIEGQRNRVRPAGHLYRFDMPSGPILIGVFDGFVPIIPETEAGVP